MTISERPKPHRLSKSRVLSGAQCPKRLWLEINRPDKLEYSEQTRNLFTTGHEVGAAARALFPKGVLIEHDRNMPAAIAETQQLLAQPGPLILFEATFQAEDVLVRTDILIRDENNQYRLIEVKSSTGIHDYHYLDCAVQLWVLENCGLQINQLELATINTGFVYPGNKNYDGLFTFNDLLADIRALQNEMPTLANGLKAVLEKGEPDIEIGDQCNDPFACPFQGYCYPPQPEKPITWIPGGVTVHQRLLTDGYSDIRQIPEGYFKTPNREWVRRVTVSGEPELKPKAAKKLNDLKWPRYYLDFETMSPAVPIYASTSPYKAEPFQWSCHIEKENGELTHHEFLAAGDKAPMREFAETLLEVIGDSGPILVYSHYEKTVLEKLIARFEDLTLDLQSVIQRLVDLLPITKTNYYHPDMQGSWSIKSVLPTIGSESSYDSLESIADGMQAQVAFMRLARGELDETDVQPTKQDLLKYCETDTLAMVALSRFFRTGELQKNEQ